MGIMGSYLAPALRAGPEITREGIRRSRCVPPKPFHQPLDVFRAVLQARQQSSQTEQSELSLIGRFVIPSHHTMTAAITSICRMVLHRGIGIGGWVAKMGFC